MNDLIRTKTGKVPLRIVGPFSDIRTRAEIHPRGTEYGRVIAARPVVG
jgi:hypothetical protein